MIRVSYEMIESWKCAACGFDDADVEEDGESFVVTCRKCASVERHCTGAEP